MLKQLKELASKALDELNKVSGLKEIRTWQTHYLGKKSSLTQILRSLATLPAEERREIGARANEIKATFEIELARKKKTLEKANIATLVKQEALDITLPGYSISQGRLHPITQMVREICSVFGNMGFQVVEGPDVEWDYYNFEALNIPKSHPARDMFATLWVDFETENGDKPILLRTHTSPVQIRVMERTPPPIRAVIPGRVYRYEATDATHEWMLYQIEGLAVDKHITMADLKGTLFEFTRRLFGDKRKVRFRCDYFPFVEPGVELAIDCTACGGAGCRLCGNTGWLEILGAGMVHPDVLKRVNIDPKTYTGFAFGMGVERISMLRYGIDDIRLFYSNDLGFLKQF